MLLCDNIRVTSLIAQFYSSCSKKKIYIGPNYHLIREETVYSTTIERQLNWSYFHETFFFARVYLYTRQLSSLPNQLGTECKY